MRRSRPSFRRAARGIALHDEDLRAGGVALAAVGQLAGQRRAVERALALHQVTGAPRCVAGPRGGQALLDHAAALAGVAVEVLAQGLSGGRLDQPLDLGVAQLGLGLALKLRLSQLDADHRREALAGVLAADVGVPVLEQLLAPREVVEPAGQRRAEARQVRAALGRVDRVGERVDAVGEIGVVLQRHLDGHPVDLPVEIERQRLQHIVVAVEEAHVGLDAALEVEVDLAVGRRVALVAEADPQALVQIGDLAETVGQHIELVVERLHHVVVGEPANHRAGHGRLGARRALLAQFARRHAAREGLRVDPTAAPHLDQQLARQRVDHRRAHAVQAAGDFVAAAAELAARVEHGQDGLQRRLAGLLVGVDGDAAAVIADAYPAVRLERDVDLGGVAGHRFVDGVVDDLVDEMMQPGLAG